MFLIVIHAGLIIWASTLAISFLYRVDLSSESVKVRDGKYMDGRLHHLLYRTDCRRGGRGGKKKNPVASLTNILFASLLSTFAGQRRFGGIRRTRYGSIALDGWLQRWIDTPGSHTHRKPHERVSCFFNFPPKFLPPKMTSTKGGRTFVKKTKCQILY